MTPEPFFISGPKCNSRINSDAIYTYMLVCFYSAFWHGLEPQLWEGIGVNELYNLNGCEGVLKAMPWGGGHLMKSWVGDGEGVKLGLLNGVAGEAMRLNELKHIKADWSSLRSSLSEE